jgi:hypothetical protein
LPDGGIDEEEDDPYMQKIASKHKRVLVEVAVISDHSRN